MNNVKIAHWHTFAIQLIDELKVNIIQRDAALPRTDDKLMEVFRVFVEENEDPTWEQVVEALKSIDNNRLAKKIRGKFC